MSSNNRLLLADYLQGQGNFGRNYIQNTSGFRNATKGITASGAAITRNTTTPLTAIADIQIELDAATDYAEFATNSLDRSLSGQTCEMTADYKLTLGSGATVQAQVLIDGTTVHSTDLVATTTVNKVSLIYPCGDLSTSTTVRFAQTVAATTSTLNVANVYLGAAKNIGTVAQARSVAKLIRISSNQPIASSSPTKVQFNSTSFDYLGGADTTTNYRYTIKQSGDYLINTTIAIVNGTAERTEALIYKNGALACDGGQTTNASTNFISNSCTLSLATNDYIEVFVDSQSDTGYDVVFGAENTRLELTRFPTSSEIVARLDAPGVLPTAYTPTLKGSTNGLDFTNQTTTGSYQCSGGVLRGWVRTIFSGAPGTGTGFFVWSLPTGFTIDTARMPTMNAADVALGAASIRDSGTTFYRGIVRYNSTTNLSLLGNDSGNEVSPTAPMTVASPDTIGFEYVVPVTDSSPCPKSPQVLIPGSVYSKNAGIVRTEGYRVTTTSAPACTVNTTTDTGASCTRPALGETNITFGTAWSTAPACTCTSYGRSSSGATPCMIEGGISTTGITSMTITDETGAEVDGSASVICVGIQ